MSRCLLMIFWCVPFLAANLHAAELTFYCPFDGKPDAQFASGIDGAVCRTPSFTEGKKGQAISHLAFPC